MGRRPRDLSILTDTEFAVLLVLGEAKDLLSVREVWEQAMRLEPMTLDSARGAVRRLEAQGFVIAAGQRELPNTKEQLLRITGEGHAALKANEQRRQGRETA